MKQKEMKEDPFTKSMKDFFEGSIVKGKILEIRSNEVLVDIGYKSEGVVPAQEFTDFESLKVGDEVEVLLEKLEDENGMCVLSRDKAEQKKNWDKIVTICNEGGTVEGKVRSKVKGGLIVNIGVDAFLPGSQIDISPPRNLDEYVGKTFNFKVLKINADRKNIVLSRRELLEQERLEKRSKLLSSIAPGQTRKGYVKNLTDFGAFIDLDGLDGLLHITDISWGRINHPSEILKVGQEVDVVVLDVNREKERVSLGMKQRTANPWDKIEQKFPVGTRVKGKVVNIVPYGAFVELEDGVGGLIHISEFSWTKKIAKPQEVVNVGDTVEAIVLEIKKDEQKISLGIRQLESNPWDIAGTLYPVGTHVKGKVRNLTSYGAFVELQEGIDGMIHVSDMSWTRKINQPSEVFKKGDEVEAIVLEVDPSQHRIALGIKQLTDDPWKKITDVYKVGDLVSGKVTKLTSFGAFIALANDIDGLVHISQVSNERVEKIKNVLKIGDEVKARVIKIDAAERRIGLSIKAASYTPEQLEAEKALLEQLKPGEDIVAMEHAFDQAQKKP
jgi:small subunit ribosomal protein S1